MNAIYEPAGQAREYAALACNLYAGCDHACKYCYVPSIFRQSHSQFISPKPRDGILDAIAKQAPKYAGKIVTLCFTCDPYQKIDVLQEITRQAIRIFHRCGVKVCTLTKGGSRALRDIDLFGAGDEFATTLTFLDPKQSHLWEPGAASPQDRMDTLKQFYARGIFTWVSLEPTISPDVSLQIIHETHEYVNYYKVGKLNYMPTPERVDWKEYTLAAINAISGYGRMYYVKNDLKMYVPHGVPRDTRPQKQDSASHCVTAPTLF